MRRFMVVSEEYGTMIPVVDGQGPMEYERDVWEGEAKNREDAKRKALAEWTRTGARSVQDNRCDGRHPLAGSVVIETIPCPVHPNDEECEYIETRGGTEWRSKCVEGMSRRSA